MTTKALVAQQGKPLTLVDLWSQKMGPRDVRVKVRAASVNPVDWKMIDGAFPLGVAQRIVGPSGPLVVGIDFAGDVIEAGAESGIEVGTRLVGGTDFSRGQRGSYAEEVVVRPDQCAVIPDAVSYEQAACLPVAAVTPWMSLTEHTKIGQGSKVLVLGAAGGVGQFAVMLGKMLGGEVAGVCSTRNVALVERLGAVAIDYTKGDALDAAKEHGPYDLIVHAVGTDSYPLAKCRALLAPKGVVDLVVVRPGDYPCVILPSVKTILGRATTARLTPILEGIANGHVEPIIEERFPLAEGEAAHQRSRAGKVVGKLLLIP
jgi:NADPH2:quinone reductase